MPFVARKSFMANGVKYSVGDVVKGFPDEFDRYENLIRAGMVRETKAIPAKRTKKVAEEVVPEGV